MQYRITSSRTGRVITNVMHSETEAERVAEVLASSTPGREYWIEDSADGETWHQLSSWRDNSTIGGYPADYTEAQWADDNGVVSTV